MKTKYEGEKLCKKYSKKYGFPVAILRFANIYGPGFLYKRKLTVIHRFILQALLERPLTIRGDGNQKRDFIYIDDVCEAICYALKFKTVKGIKYVGWNKFISINEVVNLIEAVLDIFFDKKILVTYISPAEFDSGGEIKVPKSHLKWGWKPKVDLEQGIENILLKLV
jgi:UDP-glucose 4-epimerase